MKRIYFDNAATSFPKAPGLADIVAKYIQKNYANVNRGSYASATESEQLLLSVREQLCRLFSFDYPSHVVLTPGITYSINFILQGFLKSGDHIIISAMEHNAVFRTVKYLNSLGVEYSVANCLGGKLNIEHFRSLFKKNTVLCAMTHASNVCGSLLPAKEIGEICSVNGVAFVLDSAQTAGHIPINFSELNLSALTFSAHKGLLALSGLGGMILKPEFAKQVRPIIYGGTGSLSNSANMPEYLPDKLEAGTPNLVAIAALNHSLRYVISNQQTIIFKEQSLLNYFLDGLKNINGIKIYSGKMGNISIDFLNCDNSEAAFILSDKYAIETRAGLHCAPSAHKSLGTYPTGTVRLSLGHNNTVDEINTALQAIEKICKTN